MGTLLDFLIEHLPQFRRARLASLYSDFRQQQYNNPDGYAANLGAWEAALAFGAEKQAIPETSNSLSICAGDSLIEALESKEWGAPSTLGTVFTEAISNGHFIPKSIFLQAKPGLIENRTAGISWTLVSWALRQLGVSSWVPEQIPQGTFVILANLKKANERLLPLTSERRGRVDQIWPMVSFKASVSKLLDLKESITDEDLQVLLMYLFRDQKLLAYEDNFVKFRGSATELPKITEQDKNIASLKTLIHDLSTQIHQISTRVESLDQQARSSLVNKNKTAALRYLRSRKFQQSVLNQRSDTLIQLEDVLNQIEQAANQVEVMDVLKLSTGVLKALNAQLGDMDSLQDVLDSINEEMMKTREISETIGDTTQAGLVLDEGEIDEELAALEAQAREEKTENETQQVHEKLNHLPSTGEISTAEARQPETDQPVPEAI